MKDMVNSPAHYKVGNIECIDYIDDVLQEDKGFYVGNIIKYVARYKLKNGLEDLKKAKWYLDRLISKMESEKESGRKVEIY